MPKAGQPDDPAPSDSGSAEGIPIGRPRDRKLDPDRTRRDILAVAIEEFAERGLSGARVDAIAARTQTTKRMIYYYFGSKDGLYLAALEEAYRAVRNFEQALDLDSLEPVDALRRLIEATFDHYETNPQFIRLVTDENINHGIHVAASETIRGLNATIVDSLAGILARGAEQGLFRTDFDAVDVHFQMTALCFYRVSNRYTFGTLFGRDFADPELRDRHRRMITDSVLRTLSPQPAAAPKIGSRSKAA